MTLPILVTACQIGLFNGIYQAGSQIPEIIAILFTQYTIRSYGQMNAETVTSETANIPVLGLSSCEHSVISLLSASVFTSTELTPMYMSNAITF